MSSPKSCQYQWLAGAGLAIAAVVVAFLLRYFLERLSDGTLPLFITFYPAVVFSAFLWGWRAGLSTTFLSVLLAIYFVIAPTFSWRVQNVDDAVGIVFFILTACAICYLASRYVKIGELVDLNRQRALELEQINEKKDEYMAVLAHELRNPLAAILSGVELIQMSCQGSCGSEVGQVANVVLQQTRQISRLIDDLLDVGRVARGKVQLHLSHLDLVKLVCEAGECQRTLFENGNVKFKTDVPDEEMWCEVDPVRIMQIIGNLVHNAVKFTSHGVVTLKLERRYGLARISVVDTGAGIDTEFLPHIFEPFIQSEQSLARSHGGLGLGLALVKGLIKLHGGEVSVESRVNEGSTFTVTLPLVEKRWAPSSVPPIRALDKRHRILAIDDAPAGLYVLQMLLKRLGQEVETASSGLEGVVKAAEVLPEIVLCDIGLPDIDGYEVARRIRNHPQLSQVRMIAVTGYSREEDRRLAMEAGFDFHIAKPISVDQLETILSWGGA